MVKMKGNQAAKHKQILPVSLIISDQAANMTLQFISSEYDTNEHGRQLKQVLYCINLLAVSTLNNPVSMCLMQVVCEYIDPGMKTSYIFLLLLILLATIFCRVHGKTF